MKTTEKLIANRVKGGFNESDSRELLNDLLAKHSHNTLAAALSYFGFCSARMAESFAASITA